MKRKGKVHQLQPPALQLASVFVTCTTIISFGCWLDSVGRRISRATDYSVLCN